MIESSKMTDDTSRVGWAGSTLREAYTSTPVETCTHARANSKHTSEYAVLETAAACVSAHRLWKSPVIVSSWRRERNVSRLYAPLAWFVQRVSKVPWKIKCFDNNSWLLRFCVHLRMCALNCRDCMHVQTCVLACVWMCMTMIYRDKRQRESANVANPGFCASVCMHFWGVSDRRAAVRIQRVFSRSP